MNQRFTITVWINYRASSLFIADKYQFSRESGDKKYQNERNGVRAYFLMFFRPLCLPPENVW